MHHTKFEDIESLYKDFLVFGIDEAGRGPVAGPLSVACLSFETDFLHSKEFSEKFKDLNDSKKLSEKKRNSLYALLTEDKNVIYGHIFVSNLFIDRFGIAEAIFQGIRKLTQKFSDRQSFYLIDGNYNFEKKFSGSEKKFIYKSYIKGDERIASISGASIIAKVKRDRLLERIAERYPEYEFQKNKGYGTKDHMRKIEKIGVCRYHRKSFLKSVLEEQWLFPEK